jgi:biopolymer transport protein ExbB/TolQ
MIALIHAIGSYQTIKVSLSLREGSWVPNHTLLLRFALVNVVALGLLAAAWMQGWLIGFSEWRTWIMSLAIFGVFVWGLMLTGFRLYHVNQTLLTVTAGHDDINPPYDKIFARLRRCTAQERALATDMARMEFGNNIGAIRYIANSLVFLGLIGTVIGFIIGLSGIDAAATKDVDKIAPMITELINGMSVALYTTLLGAVLNIWLNINLRILTDGSVRLLAVLVDQSAQVDNTAEGLQAAGRAAP